MGQILTAARDKLATRNAAAMAAGRAAFEAAPELADDDTPSEDDCRSQAEDELLTTAEPLADWIAKKCDCDQGRQPINTGRLQDVDLIDCDRVPVLLACIVAGDWQQQKAATSRLRALYVKAERKAVESRVEQLMTGSAL